MGQGATVTTATYRRRTEATATDPVPAFWLCPSHPLPKPTEQLAEDAETRAIESDPDLYRRILVRLNTPGGVVSAEEALGRVVQRPQ